jgi:hypothetical protein
MKKIILFSILLINNCQAQETIPQSGNSYQNSLLKAIEIQHEFMKTLYFYGETKLDNPYALQIPFKSMNDKEVLNGYKNYKLCNSYAQGVHSVALLVFILNRKPFADDPKKFVYLYGTTFITSFVFRSIGRQKLKKAINRFNSLLIP